MRRLTFLMIMFLGLTSLSFAQQMQPKPIIIDTANTDNHWTYQMGGTIQLYLADSAGYISILNSKVETRITKIRVVLGDTIQKQEVYYTSLNDVGAPGWNLVNSVKLKNDIKRQIKQGSIKNRLNQE